MYLYIIIGIILIILIYFFLTYNNLKKLDNRVDEAFSTMDIYLKKRWDLIPNLVSIVKKYSEYEKNTLENIIKLRNNLYDNLSKKEKINTNINLEENINLLIAKIENYPDLKASENYLDLAHKLTKIEEDIANSRKYYNGIVRIFNNKVEMFPSNIVAKILKYQPKLMFEAKAIEKENIKINLGE